jgi:hypothetical protein
MVRSRRDGYATPAATIISMAVAIVVIANLTRATSELRLARAEFNRTKTEYALSAAQNLAVLSIAASSSAPPFRWTLTSLTEGFSVIAEPERSKLALAAVDQLDDTLLSRLEVGNPDAFRARLAALAARQELAWPAEASSRLRWRICGPSLISFYGAAPATPDLVYSPPEAGQTVSHWRAGEVWRIAVTSTDGWRDERIVRFTGNGLNPVAVIGRRLTRGWKDTPACDSILDAA